MGLIPAGIQEMRLFIRELVQMQGKTVFLSSHLLSEVEQVCDRVAIIHQGRIVREGRVAEPVGSTAHAAHRGRTVGVGNGRFKQPMADH